MTKKREDKIKRLRRHGEPIIVNSKAYGKHERAPRFTYKPRTESPSLKKFSDLNGKANGIAKVIKLLQSKGSGHGRGHGTDASVGGTVSTRCLVVGPHI